MFFALELEIGHVHNMKKTHLYECLALGHLKWAAKLGLAVIYGFIAINNTVYCYMYITII